MSRTTKIRFKVLFIVLDDVLVIIKQIFTAIPMENLQHIMGRLEERKETYPPYCCGMELTEQFHSISVETAFERSRS